MLIELPHLTPRTCHSRARAYYECIFVLAMLLLILVDHSAALSADTRDQRGE